MSALLWIAVSVVLGLIGIGVALRALVGSGHRDFEMSEGDEEGAMETSMAPLQKRAWWGLGIGTAITAIIVAVLILKGPDAYNEDASVRLLVLFLLIGGGMAYLLTLFLTVRRSEGEEVILDERDRMILDRAPAVQVVAMLVALALWSVVLTEVYWEEGQVPIVFPTIIFWSCFLINILALPIGILLGYSRR